MGMGAAVTRLFDKLGYRITPRWREQGLALATLTREVIAIHGIDTVIDVGANIGQYKTFLRVEAGFSGDIISFEPQPGLVGMLVDQAKNDPHWVIHGCGLGSSQATLNLNVMHSSPFTSFLEPDNGAFDQFAGHNQVKERHEVSVHRLDAMELPIAGRNLLLKCDTQGFDMEVVRGATAILPQIKALQVEIPIRSIYKGVPDYRDTLRELEALGFTPAGFYPVSRDPMLAGIEFDCLLVRGIEDIA